MNSLCKILIVDDESILRNGLKYLCAWEDELFTIVGEASNGKEAIAMVEKLQPHIVITDIVMPIIDGVELSKIIKKKYPYIKVLILSSYSEFDYIKETFKQGVCDYLLKPKVSKETLLPILKKIREEIDVDYSPKCKALDNELELKLLEFISSDKYDSYNIDALLEYFCKPCFFIIKASLNLISKKYSENRFDMKSKLDMICKKLLEDYTYMTIEDNNEYIILINIDKHDELEVINHLNTLAKKVNLDFNNTLFLRSNIIENIYVIPKKNLYMSTLLNKAFYFYNESIITEDYFKIQKENSKFKNELYNSNLIGLDFNQCNIILADYFEEVKDGLSLDEYSLKKFCQNIIYNTLNTVDGLGFDVSSVSSCKMKIFKSIDLAYGFDELVEIVLGVIVELTNYIDLEINNNKSIMINKVKEFIQKNYRDNLSLSNIAQELHINYYYLSYYFKHQTKENLSVYINKVRIEKAKIYLADNTIPISEISEIVGFSEHNYFSKTFKKYTNLTPTEYRRKILNL